MIINYICNFPSSGILKPARQPDTTGASHFGINMGIERRGRKPKRIRTTARRMRGRRKIVFLLPEGPPATESKKATSAKESAPKKQRAKKAPEKIAATDKKPAKKKES